MAAFLPKPLTTAIPLVLGLATSSLHLYGNIGTSTTGLLPYLTSTRKDASPNSPPRFTPFQIVQGINWYIDRGATALAAPNALAAVFYAVAAFYHPASPRTKLLCMAAAGASLAVIPWTVTLILPVNKALAETEKAGEAKCEASSGEGERALALVEKWQGLHSVRIGLGTVAWTCGVLALGIL